MRLSKIKLAGFKSFVEPTTIIFPNQVTGIIGPNGCGKSNTIDAVRWVMGESSAKQLRGDSMDDVIFNGSSARSAVNRASVELVFDNSDRTLLGQYAAYNEISIRREVSRESGSNYYLNGSKCRRRDIADIFLGTGLGPRSYAIIEQGMISRIIEAKPEELRVYLEEAAGISKYKERRRETENRIKHTRENLDRLNDLREEVDKQLKHLERQAKAAERYKVLKAEERELKAQLLVLRWSTLNDQVEADQKQLTELQTRLEAVIADQREVEASVENLRSEQTEAHDRLNQVQGSFYKVGSEISRIEQNIKHFKETRERQQHDLQQIDEAWQEARGHIEDDRARLDDLQHNLQTKSPTLDALKETEQHASEQLADAERTMRDWQHEWDEFSQQFSQTMQVIEVETSRVRQLGSNLERSEQRRTRVAEEQDRLSSGNYEDKLTELYEQEAAATMIIDDLNSQNETTANDIGLVRQTLQTLDQDIDQLRTELSRNRGQLASLEALQQAALGQQNETTSQWLQQHQLHSHSQVAQQLQVPERWQLAVETVLGQQLEAVCVDNIEALAADLMHLEAGSLMLVQSDESPAIAGTLADQVQSELINGLLNTVYTADTLAAALQQRARLQAHESVITPEGLWIGPNWLRIKRADDTSDSVLGREQQIKQCQESIEQHEAQLDERQEQRATQARQLNQHEQQRDELQQQLQQRTSEAADVRSQLNSLKNQIQQTQQRQSELTQELSDIEQLIQQDNEAIREAELNLEQARTHQSVATDQQTNLQARREELSQRVTEARERVRADRQALHEIEINLESLRTARETTDKNLERMQTQLAHLQARREALLNVVDNDDTPLENMQAELNTLLAQRIKVEQTLNESRTRVETVEHQIRDHETRRSALEHKVQDVRSKVEERRLNTQETRVRCQTIKEQLDTTEFAIEALLENLPDHATIKDWTQQVEALALRISRMGPINLAAIDEQKEHSERRDYLEAQFTDLTQALETLETAIEKIDKETRSRFKDVFEQVNTRLKDMFPRLFGGGQAYLELTGHDLLSTGVSIMARPPGKRISNIHLMSGGEKALTAVAMVFAIFELNPAPFCMLDEVDAPLDEANVGRFAKLVKEMSEQVQFIVITHNKTTMEMMDQLSGVTMREAGVSRLVAVDIDEAVKMTAA